MPFEGKTFDFDLVWSMDAMLHSGNRETVMAKVMRVFRPGSQFIFTYILMAEDATQAELKPAPERIRLDTLGP